jgi:hypothetical protein
MNKLSALINELETKLPYSDKLNTLISQSSVGWHIQHTVLAANRIIDAISHSNPQNYKWKFNVSRTIVFALNKIPRGKGKAPASALPQQPFNAASLLQDIQLLKSKIQSLSNLQPNNYFEHPYFGHLNVKGTKKMLTIHTQHHIAIINDIIQK